VETVSGNHHDAMEFKITFILDVDSIISNSMVTSAITLPTKTKVAPVKAK